MADYMQVMAVVSPLAAPPAAPRMGSNCLSRGASTKSRLDAQLRQFAAADIAGTASSPARSRVDQQWTKDMFDPREKIALFIDGANLYATAKALGFDIDYKRLLQEFQGERLSAAGVLLHRAGGGSGIFVDPPADRLAGLQRLHRGHQADQGVRRCLRPAQDQGQHGHRACRRCHGDGRIRSIISCSSRATAIFARWSRPCSGRGRKVSVISTLVDAAADDRRRASPPGRPFRRPPHPPAEDRPRSERTGAAPARSRRGIDLRGRVRGRRRGLSACRFKP